MARMVDMIRQSAVPPNLLRTAAKGALSVPAAEMIEILVLLAANPVVGEQARLTLAGWDEAACRAAASDPHTAREVLEYMVEPRNRRPSLFAALLENPALPQTKLAEIAADAGREVVEQMLASARVRKSGPVLQALANNKELRGEEGKRVRELLGTVSAAPSAGPEANTGPEPTEQEIKAFVSEHAAEIAAEEGKPFHVMGGVEEIERAEPAKPAAAPAAPVASSGHATAAAAKEDPKKAKSVLQKIAALTVGERVQLAMKGNKDERFLLIRDGARVVPQAVLESPKLTDTEAEMFASMKNVQEVVFRGLSTKRKFAKNYRVQRNLAFNPKVPIDLALNLVNNLLLSDLKALSVNKEVPETVRKAAVRLFVQKSDSRKK